MSAALIAVDIGNTAIKFGWFSVEPAAPRELPRPVVALEWPTEQTEIPLGSEHFPPRVVGWFVSSVNRPGHQRLTEWLGAHRPLDPTHTLTYQDVPLAIEVDAPERVGMDRLATAVAANHLRDAGRAALVIDAGTALKVHLVTEQGAFAGGAILPGFQMSSRALAGNTDLLPMVPVTTNIEPPSPLGRNTAAAIRSGLYWGAVGAVRELVTRIKSNLKGEPQVLISGGDAGGLVSLIDHDTRFIPHLCLAGIALLGLRRLGVLSSTP